jgi:NADH-quinone oxidoreductase subunit C
MTSTPTLDNIHAALDAPAAEAPAPGFAVPTRDLVVAPDRLVAAAKYVRDELGFEMLSNVTAVDYIAGDTIEMVYHFFRVAGGPPFVLKTRTNRADPVVPSLSTIWPAAELQEREAYDLFGVRFSGHRDLRRIYMWDEFAGFPMRKDFVRQGDKYFAEGDEE